MNLDTQRTGEALTETYGSPQVVYSILVRVITKGDYFEYGREGLQWLQDQYVLNYDAINALVEDSSSQFLTQHARQFFSPKLKEEWDKHVSGREEMPNINDLRKYIRSIIYQMEPKARATLLSSSDSSSSHTPHVKKKLSEVQAASALSAEKSMTCEDASAS